MAINNALLIARRRNIQKLKMEEYINRFREACGALDSSQILPASMSIKIERDAISTLEHQRVKGRQYDKKTGMSRSQAEHVIINNTAVFGETESVVLLDNHMEFIFRSNFRWYFKHIFQLSDFSGDTVFATSLDMKYGAAFDQYTEGRKQEPLYELELWGEEGISIV